MYDYIPATQAVAASATTLFTDQQLPAGGLNKLVTVTTGANNGLNTSTVGIGSLRVKLGGNPIIDATPIMLRTLLENIGGPANFTPSTELRFHVPLDLNGVGGYDESIGIPRGVGVSYEIVTNSDGSTGTAQVGYKRAIGNVTRVPRYVQQAAGWGASASSARAWFDTPGVVYGVFIPLLAANGIARAKLVLQGIQCFNLSTQLLINSQAEYCPCAVTAGFFVRVPVDMLGLRATKGDSYLEVDTGSSNAASDPVALYTIEDLAAAVRQ